MKRTEKQVQRVLVDRLRLEIRQANRTVGWSDHDKNMYVSGVRAALRLVQRPLRKPR